MELDAANTTTITMERTVPIGLHTCSDLSFQYDHADSGVAVTSCQAFFKEERSEHPISRANTGLQIIQLFDGVQALQQAWWSYVGELCAAKCHGKIVSEKYTYGLISVTHRLFSLLQ